MPGVPVSLVQGLCITYRGSLWPMSGHFCIPMPGVPASHTEGPQFPCQWIPSPYAEGFPSYARSIPVSRRGSCRPMRHSPDDGPELQEVHEQNQGSVAAEVPVNEDEGELHQDGGAEHEENGERQPEAVLGVAVGETEDGGRCPLPAEKRRREDDAQRQLRPRRGGGGRAAPARAVHPGPGPGPARPGGSAPPRRHPGLQRREEPRCGAGRTGRGGAGLPRRTEPRPAAPARLGYPLTEQSCAAS